MAETTVKMDDFGMFFAVLALHSFLFSEQLVRKLQGRDG